MKLNKLIQIAAVALAGAIAAHGEPKLTGVYITSTDNAGKLQGVGAHHFKTFDHGGQPGIFLVQGEDLNGPIINGPNLAQNPIAKSLTVGTHTFTIFADKANSYNWNYYALNLYFDFNNDPQISGWAPQNIQSRDFFPPFQTNPGPMLGNGTKPSPGLTWKSGQIEVKLTAWQFSNPTIFNMDRVRPFEATKNNIMDYVGSFTLEVSGPPEIYTGGTVNAASFSNKVAPGSIFSIFGSGLAPRTESTPGAPLPTSLAGVNVTVGGKTAPLFFVSSGQVNAQLPYELEPGTAEVLVTVNGVASNKGTVNVIPAAPGIFQFGEKRAIVQNQDYSLNTAENPASNGSMVVAYLTGSGALDFPVQTGRVAGADPLSRPRAIVTATVNGQPAEVAFAGLTPSFVGLMQVNLRVPTLTPGTYPLVITVGGEKSNAAMITVKQ
jgi:uncharacterized protein (TIGR03437 family)